MRVLRCTVSEPAPEPLPALAETVTPVLASWLLPRLASAGHGDTKALTWLKARYETALRRVLAHPRRAVAAAAVADYSGDLKLADDCTMLAIRRPQQAGVQRRAGTDAIYPDMGEFTNHEMVANKGDIFYLFTDGYSDQFGGERGKKFMSRNFKNLLAENAHKTPTLRY